MPRLTNASSQHSLMRTQNFILIDDVNFETNRLWSLGGQGPMFGIRFWRNLKKLTYLWTNDWVRTCLNIFRIFVSTHFITQAHTHEHYTSIELEKSKERDTLLQMSRCVLPTKLHATTHLLNGSPHRSQHPGRIILFVHITDQIVFFLTNSKGLTGNAHKTSPHR